jgi:hypothetical protein
VRFPALSRFVLTSLGAFSLFTMGGENAKRRSGAQDEKPGQKQAIVATDDASSLQKYKTILVT